MNLRQFCTALEKLRLSVLYPPGYDSGEKKRIPAWCDRVIYRDTQSSPFSQSNLQCPVVSSVIMYEACMDVTESDHKPVRCKFHATIAHVDKSVRRQELGNIIRSNEKIRSILEDLKFVPETTVSTNNIVLQSQDTVILTITNKSTSKAIYSILCGGQTIVRDDDGEESDYTPRGSFGLPRWLEVLNYITMLNETQNLMIFFFCRFHWEVG